MRKVSLALQIPVVLLLVAVDSCFASSPFLQDEDLYKMQVSHMHDLRVNIPRDVIFELYTRENADVPEKMDIESMSQNDTRPKFFDPKRPVRIIVHGWSSGSKKMTRMRQAFHEEGHYNVILMNWSKVDNVFYPMARLRVEPLGRVLSDFLGLLVDIYGLDVADFHIIGCSLGAHISGAAGRYNKKGRIGRITGLDPAGPLFKKAHDILSYDAAAFVDVIHTCGKFFGHWEPMGHADFYPNGGYCFQPGCIFSPRISCSHNRARDLFVESINSQKGFWAWPFNGGPQGNFTANEDKALMGYHIDKRVRGVYYLETSGRSPYAICPPFNVSLECTG